MNITPPSHHKSHVIMKLDRIANDHRLLTRTSFDPGHNDLWAIPFVVADFNRQTGSDCTQQQNFHCATCANSHNIETLILMIDRGRLHVCGDC